MGVINPKHLFHQIYSLNPSFGRRHLPQLQPSQLRSTPRSIYMIISSGTIVPRVLVGRSWIGCDAKLPRVGENAIGQARVVVHTILLIHLWFVCWFKERRIEKKEFLKVSYLARPMVTGGRIAKQYGWWLLEIHNLYIYIYISMCGVRGGVWPLRLERKRETALKHIWYD